MIVIFASINAANGCILFQINQVGSLPLLKHIRLIPSKKKEITQDQLKLSPVIDQTGHSFRNLLKPLSNISSHCGVPLKLDLQRQILLGAKSY